MQERELIGLRENHVLNHATLENPFSMASEKRHLLKMLVVKEVLLILMLTQIQLSLQKSSTTSSTKYERVTVNAHSFNDIRTTNLPTAG